MALQHDFHKEAEIFANYELGMQSLIMQVFQHGVDHTHKIVVLAIGVMGFVIPFLTSAEATRVHPWFLKAALICFGSCAMLGVLSAWASRYWVAWAFGLMTQRAAAWALVIRTPDDPAERARLIDEAEAADKAFAARVKRSRYLTFPVDVIFHWLFVLGAYFLLRGLLLGSA